MLTTFWSVKGGVGTSTVTALCALARAGRADPSVAVDLCGDLPAVLGVDDPDGPGIIDWCESSRSPDALDRISTEVTVDLALIHRGGPTTTNPETDLGTGVDHALVEALAAHPRHSFVDCGRALDPLAGGVLARAERRLLVVRPCYLNLRAARQPDPAPTGVVVVRERGRSLGIADVESVTGAPVVAEITWDIAVARCIDAGLTAARVPRGLLKALHRVSADV